jgi:hypothetical protein
MHLQSGKLIKQYLQGFSCVEGLPWQDIFQVDWMFEAKYRLGARGIKNSLACRGIKVKLQRLMMLWWSAR